MRKAQSTHWDSRSHERLHREKLAAKLQKLETLRTLVDMHEAAESPDFEYLRELKTRLRSVEAQFRCMEGGELASDALQGILRRSKGQL